MDITSEVQNSPLFCSFSLSVHSRCWLGKRKGSPREKKLDSTLTVIKGAIG